MQSGFWDGHQLSPACADQYAQARSGQMAIQAGISAEILKNQVSFKNGLPMVTKFRLAEKYFQYEVR
jgi:hypothetical protein